MTPKRTSVYSGGEERVLDSNALFVGIRKVCGSVSLKLARPGARQEGCGGKKGAAGGRGVEELKHEGQKW
jgi:hypothetical protein